MFILVIKFGVTIFVFQGRFSDFQSCKRLPRGFSVSGSDRFFFSYKKDVTWAHANAAMLQKKIILNVETTLE